MPSIFERLRRQPTQEEVPVFALEGDPYTDPVTGEEKKLFGDELVQYNNAVAQNLQKLCTPGTK